MTGVTAVGYERLVAKLVEHARRVRHVGIMALAAIDLRTAQIQVLCLERRVFTIMTVEADGRRGLYKQFVPGTIVRGVTAQAVSLLNRRVNISLVDSGLKISMTGKAQLVDFVLQQVGYSCGVRLMAGGTLSLRHRGMITDNRGLVCFYIVAGSAKLAQFTHEQSVVFGSVCGMTDIAGFLTERRMNHRIDLVVHDAAMALLA